MGWRRWRWWRTLQGHQPVAGLADVTLQAVERHDAVVLGGQGLGNAGALLGEVHHHHRHGRQAHHADDNADHEFDQAEAAATTAQTHTGFRGSAHCEFRVIMLLA
jgi:hypothetical protein